ncbi:MAG: ADOP family duplicated permease [Candidatus Sulfotelmatobacter sp.]
MKPVPLWRRYARFFGPDPAADVKDELRFHLDAKTDDLVAQGWKPEAARREAERQFGDMRAVARTGKKLGEKMESRKRLQDRFDDIHRDLRYTFRQLRRDPGFAGISILILALAIGSNIAVFSVVNNLLLRPLPFPDSQQLVWIAPPPTDCGLSCSTYSADAYNEFREGSRVYQDVTGYFAFSTPDNLRLTGRGDPPPATSINVIGIFFHVLGVQPALGRLFTPDEERGAQPVALLSNAYWRRQFQADPSIVGQPVELNGTPVTIVGVLPDTFDFGAVFSPGAKVDLFTPFNLVDAHDWGNIVTLVGRLKPGVTLAQSLDDANRVAPTMYFSTKYPQTLGRYKGDLVPVPLKDYVTGKLRHSLILLWTAVGMILLIACVNLSNLLLSRAVARGKEFAVRGALGASRGRVIRQLLIESLVLSGSGGVLGLGLAFFLISWLASQGSLALPLLSTLRIDGQAVAWSVLIAAAAAGLFGLAPGFRMAMVNLQEALKDSGPGAGLGRKNERVRAVLVVSEVALACMLLVGAGLLLRSFMRVLDVDLGFRPEHAASIRIDYDDNAPSFDERAIKRGVIFQQVIDRVTAVPGVEAAGMADYLPLGPNREWDTPVPQGKTFAPGELPDPLVYVITPGFIRAMGIHLHGRDFTWADGPKSQPVVLINASAARTYWPGEDAVGKILSRGGDAYVVVVGVVDDVREENVESGTAGQIYYPATQQNPSSAQMVVRSTLAASTLAPSVLRALRELNPKQPAAEFRPIRTIVDHAVSPRRFFMLLVMAFAALGLLLAALGIYGVISYSVTRQRQDIGVRMALGASAGRVQRSVLMGTLRLALIGLFVGTIASFACARLMSSLLFGTSPWDGVTYAGMAVALIAVALISGYLPARRASRTNPIIALRSNG